MGLGLIAYSVCIICWYLLGLKLKNLMDKKLNNN